MPSAPTDLDGALPLTCNNRDDERRGAADLLACCHRAAHRRITKLHAEALPVASTVFATFNWRRTYPGARYSTASLTAWSTSSGVRRTMVLSFSAPLALVTREAAETLTLLGRSTIS